MKIDDIIREAIDAGYSMKFKIAKHEGKINFTYTIQCADGCAYGRGIVLDDIKNFPILTGGALDVLTDSIEKTLPFIKEKENESDKVHQEMKESELFA